MRLKEKEQDTDKSKETQRVECVYDYFPFMRIFKSIPIAFLAKRLVSYGMSQNCFFVTQYGIIYVNKNISFHEEKYFCSRK